MIFNSVRNALNLFQKQFICQLFNFRINFLLNNSEYDTIFLASVQDEVFTGSKKLFDITQSLMIDYDNKFLVVARAH